MRRMLRLVVAGSVVLLSGCELLRPTVPFIERSFEHRVREMERRGEKLDRELNAYIRDMNELRQSAGNMHGSAEGAATTFRGLLDQAATDLETPAARPQSRPSRSEFK